MVMLCYFYGLPLIFLSSGENKTIITIRNTLFLLTLILSSEVTADDIAAIYAKERNIFTTAEKTLRQGKITEYQALRKKSRKLPALPLSRIPRTSLWVLQ